MLTELDENVDPIFLVGAERSGTTVLRLMLAHHPQVAWCNEFEYSVDLIPAGEGYPNLDRYYEWLETHRVFLASGFVIDRNLNYPQLVNSFLTQKRDREHKQFIGATVHRHFNKLLRVWPNARFIHIVRDPRDVARSCIGMGWAGNVWTGVRRWIEAEQLWSQVKQIVPPERRIEITYETLIAEPVETLTQLSHFIGVSYDSAMLNYAESTTYGRPDPSFSYQWRRKLSEREIQLVESRVATLLTDRGYELSGLPHLRVTPLMARQLTFQDWSARLRFRIQQNGLPLCLADYLSRKLGLTQWQKQVKLQLNEITRASLK